MLKKDPLSRPSFNEIISSDDFFHVIVNVKHSNAKIERLRTEHGLFKYGVTPFETGEVEIKRIDWSIGHYFLGDVKKGTKIRHGRGILVHSSYIEESFWKDDKKWF